MIMCDVVSSLNESFGHLHIVYTFQGRAVSVVEFP